MEALLESLLETEWGYVMFGIMIITALIITFFSNKPKT